MLKAIVDVTSDVLQTVHANQTVYAIALPYVHVMANVHVMDIRIIGDNYSIFSFFSINKLPI